MLHHENRPSAHQQATPRGRPIVVHLACIGASSTRIGGNTGAIGARLRLVSRRMGGRRVTHILCAPAGHRARLMSGVSCRRQPSETAGLASHLSEAGSGSMSRRLEMSAVELTVLSHSDQCSGLPGSDSMPRSGAWCSKESGPRPLSPLLLRKARSTLPTLGAQGTAFWVLCLEPRIHSLFRNDSGRHPEQLLVSFGNEPQPFDEQQVGCVANQRRRQHPTTLWTRESQETDRNPCVPSRYRPSDRVS